MVIKYHNSKERQGIPKGKVTIGQTIVNKILQLQNRMNSWPKMFLTFTFVVKILQVTRGCWWRWFTIYVPPSSLNLVLLWQLFYLFCSSIGIHTVIVTTEPLSRNESGRFGALKSDSTHHFFWNACTKSGSLRFSQFSGCWLILSVYILMSFDFPFGRLFGVR
jgi:hypothetical protein